MHIKKRLYYINFLIASRTIDSQAFVTCCVKHDPISWRQDNSVRSPARGYSSKLLMWGFFTIVKRNRLSLDSSSGFNDSRKSIFI